MPEHLTRTGILLISKCPIIKANIGMLHSSKAQELREIKNSVQRVNTGSILVDVKKLHYAVSNY